MYEYTHTGTHTISKPYCAQKSPNPCVGSSGELIKVKKPQVKPLQCDGVSGHSISSDRCLERIEKTEMKLEKYLVSLGPGPRQNCFYPVIVKDSDGTNAGICKPI